METSQQLSERVCQEWLQSDKARKLIARLQGTRLTYEAKLGLQTAFYAGLTAGLQLTRDMINGKV